jgi:hypothetical protein
MTSHEAEIINEAIVDSLRTLADLGDVLAAVSMAARLCGEALERLEQDLVSIHTAIDGL